MLRRASAILLLLVCACYTMAVRKTALDHVNPAMRTQVWSQAIGVLSSQGYVPSEMNESAGFIKTEHAGSAATCGILTCTATDRVVVLVMPDGTVRLDLLREVHRGRDVTAPYTDTEVAEVEREQERLLTLITQGYRQ